MVLYAHAAIAAMREPTDKMLNQAQRFGDSEGFGIVDETDARLMWEDMIDAALR